MIQNQITSASLTGVVNGVPLLPRHSAKKTTSSNNILFAKENRSDKNTNKHEIRRKEKRLQSAKLETRKTWKFVTAINAVLFLLCSTNQDNKKSCEAEDQKAQVRIVFVVVLKLFPVKAPALAIKETKLRTFRIVVFHFVSFHCWRLFRATYEYIIFPALSNLFRRH